MRDFTLARKLKASYRYNGKGERVLKTNAVNALLSRQFVYDDAGHLLGEYTSAGARVKEYVWLDDTLVAVLGAFPGKSYRLVETDSLGTPRAVFNPDSSSIEWRWDINPTAFGEHAPNSNPDGDANTFELNFRYPGQYYDAESSLHYNMNRYYEPGTGRYTQSDPLGLAGEPSTYGYVGGNPLNGVDPTGLIVTVVCRAIDDWRVHWYGAKHCAVFVWHWEYTHCPDKTKKVIERQFSLAANRVPFGQNSRQPTFTMDRNAFYWSGDSVAQFDIQPPNGMTNAGWDSAVSNSGDNFSLDSDYWAFLGPNSNTATDNIIENAGGVMPNIPGANQQNYGDHP